MNVGTITMHQIIPEIGIWAQVMNPANRSKTSYSMTVTRTEGLYTVPVINKEL